MKSWTRIVQLCLTGAIVLVGVCTAVRSDEPKEPTVDETIAWLSAKMPLLKSEITVENPLGTVITTKSIVSVAFADGKLILVEKEDRFTKLTDGSWFSAEMTLTYAAMLTDLNPEAAEVQKRKDGKFDLVIGCTEQKKVIQRSGSSVGRSQGGGAPQTFELPVEQLAQMAIVCDDDEMAKRVARAMKFLLVKSGAKGKKEPF